MNIIETTLQRPAFDTLDSLDVRTPYDTPDRLFAQFRYEQGVARGLSRITSPLAGKRSLYLRTTAQALVSSGDMHERHASWLRGNPGLAK